MCNSYRINWFYEFGIVLIERKQSCGFQRNPIICQKDTRRCSRIGLHCAKVKGHTELKIEHPDRVKTLSSISPNYTIPNQTVFANAHLEMSREVTPRSN